MSRFIYPLCSQNYCFSLSTCVKAQQNAWPGNRFVKCPDGYKCRRKFMGNEFRRISVYSEERDHFACGVQASGDWFKILAKESFEMPQPAAALSITNMMNPHLFFFALSISFLVVALALPCIKPVGLLPCASKGIIFHLCLSRLVLERNKTHDPEIALWNARMGINLDANLWKACRRRSRNVALLNFTLELLGHFSIISIVEFRKILA